MLADALREMRVDGIRNNVDLLLAVIEHPAFRAGDLHTGFLDEHAIVLELKELPAPALAAVSALDFLTTPREADPWRAQTGWRLGRVDQPAAWARAGQTHTARVTALLEADGVRVDVGAQSLNVRLIDSNESAARLSVAGRTVTVRADGPDRRVVEGANQTYRLQRPPPLRVEDTARDRGAAGGAGRLTAPMPGRVVKIAVVSGEQVSQNQPLITLEAMKMEHVIEAPHAGVVTEVCVQVGDQVPSGAQLLTLGPG
jgi:3-methylcrotonyl-CoA carboxylase alpha subunit